MVSGSADAWGHALPAYDPVYEFDPVSRLFSQSAKATPELTAKVHAMPLAFRMNVELFRDFIDFADGDVTTYFPSRGPLYAHTEKGLPMFAQFWQMGCSPE